MLLDWLLKTEEGNISYVKLKMSAQDRSRWSQWRWKPAIRQSTTEWQKCLLTDLFQITKIRKNFSDFGICAIKAFLILSITNFSEKESFRQFWQWQHHHHFLLDVHNISYVISNIKQSILLREWDPFTMCSLKLTTTFSKSLLKPVSIGHTGLSRSCRQNYILWRQYCMSNKIRWISETCNKIRCIYTRHTPTIESFKCHIKTYPFTQFIQCCWTSGCWHLQFSLTADNVCFALQVFV